MASRLLPVSLSRLVPCHPLPAYCIAALKANMRMPAQSTASCSICQGDKSCCMALLYDATTGF